MFKISTKIADKGRLLYFARTPSSPRYYFQKLLQSVPDPPSVHPLWIGKLGLARIGPELRSSLPSVTINSPECIQ